MNLNEAITELEEHGYLVDEAQRLDEWGKTLATVGLCLARVLGMRACNGRKK